MLDLEPYQHRVRHSSPVCVYGRVVDVVGLTVEATGRNAHWRPVLFSPATGEQPVEVVGFRGKRILLMLGDMHGIAPDSLLIPTSKPQTVRVGDEPGRVIDSMGVPIDGGPVPKTTAEVAHGRSAAPPERTRIEEPVATHPRHRRLHHLRRPAHGHHVGQRHRQSKMIGMIARTNADVNVIALIGERDAKCANRRERFTRRTGPSVVSRLDGGAAARQAYMATATPSTGNAAPMSCLLDSITRFAMAQRESDRHRRTADHERYPPSPLLRLNCWNAPGRPPGAASRASTRFWSKPTTSTTRWAMRCAAFWTAISPCRATWRRAITIRPSTSTRASAAA